MRKILIIMAVLPCGLFGILETASAAPRGGGGRARAVHTPPPAVRRTIPPAVHRTLPPAGVHPRPVQPAYRGAGPKPLTPAWYANHPKAWYATHPYRRWPVATWAGVAAWVGLTRAPIVYGYGDSGTTVIYEQAPTDTQSVADASTNSQADPNVDPASEWMPMGAFNLLPPGQTEPTVMIQLAINKQGVLGGSYHDVMTDKDYSIEGSLDKNTQILRWTVEGNQNIVYQTDLNNLMKSEVPLLVRFGDEKTQKWTMTPMAEPKDEPQP